MTCKVSGYAIQSLRICQTKSQELAYSGSGLSCKVSGITFKVSVFTHKGSGLAFKG